jgi:hypothetical protein
MTIQHWNVENNSDRNDTQSPLDVLTTNLTPSQHPTRDTNMEVEGLDGGGSGAQTVIGTTSDMARKHDVQPAPSIGHSGGTHSYPINAPNIQSRFEGSESGTLHTSTPAERVEKRDTETIQMDTTTEHATPPNVRERTRSKTRHIAAQ